MQAVSRLGDNLRHARRAAGLSQEELARRSKVGANTIARIEAGAYDNPRLDTLRKLAAVLGVSAKDLVPNGE